MARIRSIALVAAILFYGSAQIAHSAGQWATSEGSCYSKGQMNLSLAMTIDNFGFYTGFEYAFHDALSAGGSIGFNGYSDDWTYYSYHYRYMPIMGRVAFHPFNLNVLKNKIAVRDKFDVYVGNAIGYNVGWYSYTYSNPYYSINSHTADIGGFIFGPFIGGRFYFNPKFAVFIENGAGAEGAGMQLLNFGATFKF